jgi:hypothetical protein
VGENNMGNKYNRFTFATCSRSGHHAIINWLMHMCGEPSIWQDGVHTPPQTIHGRFTYGERNPNDPYDTVCWSYENEPVQKILDMERKLPILTAPERNIYSVTVRDLFNWWGTIAYTHGTDHQFFQLATHEWLDVWKEHMGHAIRGKLTVHDGVLVPISFNKWFVDLEYRKQIAKDFNLEFDDSAKETIHVSHPRYEDYEEYKDRASELGILTRWKLAKDKPAYWEAVERNQDAVEMSNTYFGDVREGA